MRMRPLPLGSYSYLGSGERPAPRPAPGIPEALLSYRGHGNWSIAPCKSDWPLPCDE